MCNNTGLGCPRLCYQLLKGNPSLPFAYKMYYGVDHRMGVKKVQIFQSRIFQWEIHSRSSSLVRRKYLLRRQRLRPAQAPALSLVTGTLLWLSFLNLGLIWFILKNAPYSIELSIFHLFPQVPIRCRNFLLCFTAFDNRTEFSSLNWQINHYS